MGYRKKIKIKYEALNILIPKVKTKEVNKTFAESCTVITGLSPT